MTVAFEMARDLQRARLNEADRHLAVRHDGRRIRRPALRGVR
jgi:hypothetical protein